MATPYRYVGADARDYPTLGFSVTPGDVLYLQGRPPDEASFEAITVDAPAGTAIEPLDWRAPIGDEPAVREDYLTRPAKAASADEWRAYALADGGFQEATGTTPDEATRKAIVDHYTAEADDTPKGD